MGNYNMNRNSSSFCLSLDLEVSKKTGRINKIGAVRADTGEHLICSGRGLKSALDDLDRFSDGASHVLGHNLIEFDLPVLRAAKPDLQLLKLPAIDTLRLSPLAFPRNPYHSLVKHYQDGSLKRGRINDPELDARLALEVFDDQREALRKAAPDLLAAWHALCVSEPDGADRALNGLFIQLRQAPRPIQSSSSGAIGRLLSGVACATQVQWIFERIQTLSWSLAYALAWMSVAGGNSVMPPWVRHQFPEAGQLVRRLRDTSCSDPACGWCRERHDAHKELKRWFGFGQFRPEPALEDGSPMQQAIVEQAMAGNHVFGILPTGTGKSLCYQVPALSRYDKTGALTVVISPLVALMADQVAGMERHGISSCITVNGLLSMPERADALDRVRLGDAGILLISPEQLRSRALVRALDQREIGAWVLDEAHCLSRWGHDFRPDYQYVGRFIRKKAGNGPVPPVLCLTATAKPDVIGDVKRHFSEKIGIELAVYDGGSERANLTFEVRETTGSEKFSDIHQILAESLPPNQPGGAIIYCSTRRRSEEIAEFLKSKDLAGDHFHAKLSPEKKKEVQRQFIDGNLRAIAATNAFGMGIDKPDVRLVIHADIPGSLENYLQEAGRAGRDRDSAHCVLLFSNEDVERQFSLSAYSRLNSKEIHGILRAVRNLDRKKRFGGEVVATAGEILIEDEDRSFERDSATDDNRVRTAVAWLEESELLTREENSVQVFPSSLRITSLDEADKLLAKRQINDDYRKSLRSIAQALIGADPDEGLSTDELMGVSRLSPEGVRNALFDLESIGIASNDTVLTAFVHKGVVRSSKKRLGDAIELEKALIALLRESAPDLGKGNTSTLQLRIAAQKLKDQQAPDPLPERLWRIIRCIGYDGRSDDDGAAGSLTARKSDSETLRITLHREWGPLAETASWRHQAAGLLLDHLINCLPSKSRGTDLLAETTLGNLQKAMESHLEIRNRSPERRRRLLDRALLWLHEQEVIRLNKGLAVFRPAMTIKLEKNERRGFSRTDFKPLELHYKGQVLQIHVMVEFANLGIADIRQAMQLSKDYFSLPESKFLEEWMPGRDEEIGRQTTPESWRAIVESLNNPMQQRIVGEERENINALVLAGPGSGKTRVLVHRIAWLIRVKRENSRGILALAYNRHAAVEIRRRLFELIGDDARGVTVLTCHGLAMRLAGASFTKLAEQPDDGMFDQVLREAAALLKGEGLLPEEADEQRQRLLAGFRWILVDEYQDIGRDQYELISALAGRSLKDDASRLTLFAVGDDDQNIYSFNGASVEFIRRFQEDYGAKPSYLTGNYRSTAHIVAASNAVIDPARNRMKAGRPIRVNRARSKDPPGGEWKKLDPVSRGRVQILPVNRDPVLQAQAVMTEMERLSGLDPNWNWSCCGIIAREWKYLDPVRSFCEARGIKAQLASEESPSFWRLRQTREIVRWLRSLDPKIVDAEALNRWLNGRPDDHWNDLLRQAAEEFALECGNGEVPAENFEEWLAEWGREIRRRQHGLLLLTAHRAKGLEFDHVAVLDGGWGNERRDEDPDASRRLFYVAMTRARKTLTLARYQDSHKHLQELTGQRSAVFREAAELPPCAETYSFRHLRLTLEDVDLSFAGRCPDRDPVHGIISGLAVGDRLSVLRETDRWKVLDSNGNPVGHLSNSFNLPDGLRIRSAAVYAVVCRTRMDTEPQFQHVTLSDAWEVVVPELVLEPDQ